MITSTSNPRVQWVRALQGKRRVRQREGLFIVEGTRLIREVLSSRSPARLVFYTEDPSAGDRDIVEQFIKLGVEVESVSDHVMKACSATESPQGILAVLPIPTISSPTNLDLALIADRIADPGNLGTILRTALAAGVNTVYLTPGTVDLYNPKVIRGAMGAHFHLSIIPMEVPGIVSALREIDIWIAETGSGTPYFDVDWKKPAAVVIGSEAHGPSEEFRPFATGSTHIPISDFAESLNASVASAVILFEIARQRGET